MFALWAGKALGLLKSIPREVWYIALALLLLWIWGNQRFDAGYNARTAEYAEAARKAAENAREADAEAGKAVEATRGTIEAGNARARDAAANSDDPLKDGLDALGKGS